MRQQREILVRKASGEKEKFSKEKLFRSLVRAGADRRLANDIIDRIVSRLYSGINTKRIYDWAMAELRRRRRPVAPRYNLKQALLELGPSGHPFETFVGELLKSLGYKIELRQLVVGKCVTHEVDVVARKGEKHFMVEAKFHNQAGFKTDIKTALYVRARFEDIFQSKLRRPHIHRAWLITNTKFTSEAIKYARCTGLNLLGWNYPAQNNLPRLIERAGLSPLTALTTLSRQSKMRFLREGIVLCRDLLERPGLLSRFNIRGPRQADVMEECRALCNIKLN